MSNYDLKYWGELTPTKDEQIEQTEKVLGIEFPPDVKAFLKKYSGASLYEYTMEYVEPGIGIDDTGLSQVFDFTLDKLNGIVGVMRHQHFPPDIIPFGRDPAHNYFCLDYRNKTLLEPPILFCSLDTGRDDPFIPLADNFSDFMSRLQEDF